MLSQFKGCQPVVDVGTADGLVVGALVVVGLDVVAGNPPVPPQSSILARDKRERYSEIKERDIQGYSEIKKCRE